MKVLGDRSHVQRASLYASCVQVYFDYMHSWIQMLQQLPQASHSLKNLLEEEWNFTKVRGRVSASWVSHEL